MLILLLFGAGIVYSQDYSTEIDVDYRVNNIALDAMCSDNAVCMQEITVPNTDSPEIEKWTRQLHIKTNVLGLGAGIANAAIEVDVCKHLSFSLPVYYSAWDYFKPTLKFRTLMVQPEIRYWFKNQNEGWFIGVHFGYGYYNIALDGDYRYQDHNRETPSMGGGVAIGYRTHLSKNKRWKLEFAVGGGVYPSRYDKFYNTPDTSKGLMVASDIHKTYKGIDQAAISFSYAFDLKKKGGKR